MMGAMLRTGAAVAALAFALGSGAQQPPAFELEEMTIAQLQEAMASGRYTARAAGRALPRGASRRSTAAVRRCARSSR